jgi:hypothetical protein
MREDFDDEADTTELGVGRAACADDLGDDDLTVELPRVNQKVLTHRKALGRTARRPRPSSTSR